MPREKSGDPEATPASEAPAPAARRTRDYSQRPQKPIKLKPAISREPPSPVTRLGPPREQLGAKIPGPPAPPAAAAGADPTPRAAAGTGPTPLAPASPAPTPAPVTTEARGTAPEGTVSYDDVIVYTLREMNQRIAQLERRGLAARWGALRAWFRGLLELRW